MLGKIFLLAFKGLGLVWGVGDLGASRLLPRQSCSLCSSLGVCQGLVTMLENHHSDIRMQTLFKTMKGFLL